MAYLFQIPRESRDEGWQRSFCDNVQTASFACGDPQILQGPDGFPYFVLKTPEPARPFESFCIRNMTADFLLEKGFGVVINPQENSADWVFTYGDILNLHLNKEFFTEATVVGLEKEEIIKKDEQVLIAQPSEAYLPKASRRILKAFLQAAGIGQPKIMMLCRTINGQVIQELVFNIFPEDFSSNDEMNTMLTKLSWFLPRHYVIAAFPKNSSLINELQDL